jgi:hypothetical protein
MRHLRIVLGGLLSLACAACSGGSARDRAKTARTEDEDVAALKKVLSDPKLSKEFEERVPSLQRTQWIDKEGRIRLDKDADADWEPRDQQSIVEELTLNGGEVRYSDGVVTTVVLAHLDWKTPKKEVDPGLSLLRFLPEVQTISLYNSTATDAGLRHLKGLSKLRILDLGYTATTDEGLKHLANLTKLEELGLGTTEITDAGLALLSQMNKLHTIDIRVKAITMAGIDQLAKLKQLRKVQVYEGKTQEELEHLRKQMPHCEFVK